MRRPSVRERALTTALVLYLLSMTTTGVDLATGQVSRAVLVGINAYEPPADLGAEVARKWRNLEGAVHDARAMEVVLKEKLGFAEVVVLTDDEATRDSILQSIDRHLVQSSQPGDVAVFFFAGHGSQVRNTESKEADGLDETIVPADAWRGARDIRDKELRDAFNRLLDRGVVVTLIFDSCHSGSITRGIQGGRSRYIEPDPRPIADASDPPKPVERGALVISAAQDDEVAKELVDPEGNPRGVFSWALSRAILEATPRESAEALFLRTRALMRSVGAKQEPVLAGVAARKRQSLIGGAEVEHDLLVPAIEVEDDGTVVLQGGLALGLREGTELVGVDSSDVARLRLVVTRSEGMARSLAEIVEGSELPEPGALFRVDRWVSSVNPLRLHIPLPVESKALESLTATLQELAADDELVWVDDPTEVPPDHFVSWNGTWTLQRSDGSTVDLGDELSTAAVLGAMLRTEQKPALFVSVPPFVEVAQRILARIESAPRPTQLVEDVARADYVLMGRVESDGSVAYAWVLREATTGSTTAAAPPRSDWRTITPTRLFQANLLANDAGKLDVIWGWLHLESPPDDGTFPYRFAGFENVVTGERKTAGDTLVVGERYRMVLETSALDLERARVAAIAQRADKRYIYLFIMDRNGDGALLFPPEEFGNVENDISLFSDLPLEIKVPAGDGFLFEVGDPVGVDSYFLVTSAEAIPQPGVFNFEGVRNRGPMPGEQTDLSRLFDGLGSGTRGARQPVPTNWSLQRVTVRSLEAPTAD